MVHPKNLGKMDNRLGLIVAETATTGKFFIQELEFKNTVDTTPERAVAFGMKGQIRISEPLGCRLLDYMRVAAAKLGIVQWLDARYILDIELRAENYDKDEFYFSFPIIISKIEVKSVSEKGTDYVFEFIQDSDLVQTDMLQSIIDTVTVKNVSTVGEYFKKFSEVLELQQFKLAEARQKFGSKKGGGGEHPAAGDQYHDEYYFIVDPKIKAYEFKTKEVHDPGKDTSYENKSRQNRETNKKIDITAKQGTTILAQITKVLQMAKGLEDLKPGKEKPQLPPGDGTSSSNKKNNETMLGDIHQYYRIATHVVYKKYDHIRGRYAMKHFYAIWLADQPNMYHFPEEIDLINEDKFAKTLLGRLDKLITRGYLRKAYYHWYTGLNVDVIKMNLDLNSTFYLPGVPNYWAADYNQTSDGRMEDKEKYNWNKKETPYTYGKAGPAEPVFPDKPQTAPYLEDIPFSQISRYLLTGYPQFRPRMEPTEIVKQHDNEHVENAFLVQKVFDVLTSPFDLVNMTLEIIGDPWWLGDPNVMLAGKNGLEKIKMPESMKNEIKAKLPGPDPEFNSRTISWSTYGRAQPWAAGGAQIYYCAQLPSNDRVDDLMVFDYADTISGIYQVRNVNNVFKDGKWTQTLDCRRNITIPTKVIPRFVNGEYTTFEKYISGVLAQANTASPASDAPAAAAAAAERKQEERKQELLDANLTSQNPNLGAESRVTQNTVSSDPKVQTALQRRQDLEKQNSAPTVKNPVERANELVSQGVSKEQAYTQAKKEYVDQLTAKFDHLNKLNKQAYVEAGVQKYKPYDPNTMTAIALEKSNNGGLEDWKKNSNWKGPATLNNPGGLGHDVKTGRYNEYTSFDQGVTAINDYYNYGVGVPASRNGADKYLLPNNFNGTAALNKTGNTELRYIDNVAKGRSGVVGQ